MNNFASHFALLGAQSFTMNSPSVKHPMSHQIWILEVIVRGQLQITINHRENIILRESAGILYAPGTRYQEKVLLSGDICQSIALFFDITNSLQPPPIDRFQMPYFHIDDSTKVLLPLVENCLEYLGMGASEDIRATANFLQIIYHLLSAQIAEKTLIITNKHSGGDMIACAHQFMRKHLGQPLRLSDIANAVGMSVSGFAHGYKRQTGISPMLALRRMRTDAVKSHLMHNRQNLEQIAEQTGFADAFHLSRTFKQITGISPRQFRKGITRK